MRTRTATCAGCERDWDAPVRPGVPPAYCEPCRPVRLDQKSRAAATYRERHRAEIAANQKKWSGQNKDKIWAAFLRRSYGITPEVYHSLLELQGGGCALCGVEECSTGRRLSVDHDHNCCPTQAKSCGHCVRGLLCRQCNSTLLPGYEKLPANHRDSAFLNAYCAGRPLAEGLD